MDTLRTELIETQKTRSDLMKWKLLIVAGVGAAALGLSGATGASSSAHLALAVIPIACVYVDLLCRHLSLRNKAIGMFIAFGNHQSQPLRDYERFYDRLSNEGWGRVSLESMALVGCTVFLSISVVPVGILASGLSLWPLPLDWPASLFIGSGVSGLLLSAWLEFRYRRAKQKAEELSKQPNTLRDVEQSAAAPSSVLAPGDDAAQPGHPADARTSRG